MEDPIEINPLICSSRPVIRGTQIEDVLAAIRYASRLMDNRFHIQQVA